MTKNIEKSSICVKITPDMTTMRHFILLLILCSLLGACRQTLQSESGLYDVTLQHSAKLPHDGFWMWGKGNPYRNKKEAGIYINPLNVSLVQEENPEMARVMQYQMQDYMVQGIAAALKDINEKNNLNWVITTNPDAADVRIDMALVHFKPQRPGLRFLSLIAQAVSPIPMSGTVLGTFSKGDICIECTMRDSRSGRLLFAFKDRNRKTARLYTHEAYTRDGNADVNLQAWAHDMARLIRFSAPDRLGDKTAQEFIDKMDLGDAIRLRRD